VDRLYATVIKVRICFSDAALLNFSLRTDEREALAFGALAFYFISVDESAVCLMRASSAQTFSNLSGGTLLTRY
jgi:hypothetical protein